MKHLWEAEHPYCAETGNYYATGCHYEYESWLDFLRDMESELPLDENLNLNMVYRWDWIPKSDNPEDEQPFDELRLYVIHQRKARNVSFSIAVTPEDEPEIKEYLKIRFDYLMKVWEGIS